MNNDADKSMGHDTMTTPTDPQSLIAKAREVCEAATPGPWCAEEVVISEDHDVSAYDILQTLKDDPKHATVEPGGFRPKADATLIAAAPTLLLDLAQELEACLQYKAQLTLTLNQHRDTQQRLRTSRTELADHKANMVGLLADAYDKGRRFSEDVDDRESEND